MKIIGGALLALSIIYMVVWNIKRFIYFIKCFKIKKCSNKNCKFNSYCNKYKTTLTKEEIEQLQNLIDQLDEK
ncbi:hypothetical protein IMSAG049_01523 [Clostridiales bacterium]|nr:hypothetical protein IMSAG049_01523 [Clostridiales bacterium]